jgi:integrating conjugative element protein (TIGR03755 family)
MMKNNSNISSIFFAWPLIILFYSNGVSAAPLANSNNSAFYYQIGGARSISLPANASVKTVILDASYEYGLGYSCGNFNPLKGISDQLNSLKGIKDKLIIGAVGAVTSAISSLPALILQRINPGLYDLFQNALIRAEATIALATKTCEDYEEEIRQGKNPYKGWKNISKGIDWKIQMGTGGPNSSKVGVHTAKKNVAKNNGSAGLPWINGKKAGGIGQSPIKSTEDVVKAGYNLTLNRKPGETKPPVIKKGDVKRLVEVFKSPKEATDFAVDVIGDVYVRTYNNSKKQTIAGHGLLPKIQDKNIEVKNNLSDLVSGKTKMTQAKLAEISSNDVLITADVIQAMQRMHPSERAIAIGKLSSEVAMSNIMEKALLTRRMLITGKREPNVSQTPAGEHISDSIALLDRDIENIMFEKRMHTELASNTPALILELEAQHTNRSYTAQPNAGNEETMIEDGAIK